MIKYSELWNCLKILESHILWRWKLKKKSREPIHINFFEQLCSNMNTFSTTAILYLIFARILSKVTLKDKQWAVKHIPFVPRLEWDFGYVQRRTIYHHFRSFRNHLENCSILFFIELKSYLFWTNSFLTGFYSRSFSIDTYRIVDSLAA